MSDASTVNKRFTGKLFLFEQSLLLTEIMEQTKKLQYRSHALRSDFERINTDNKSVIELILGTRIIGLYSDTLIKTQDWIKLLSEGGKSKYHLVIPLII